MWFRNPAVNQAATSNPPAVNPAAAAAALLVPDPPLQEAEMAPPVNYDAKHEDDEAPGAMEKAVNMLRNFPWTEDDLHFYFAQVEVKMKSAGVKSNFTKLQVLSTVLPPKAINSIKNILKRQESEFPNKDAYLQAKNKLIRVFGPCENADFERAMGRVMTDKPSQLAEELIGDLCDRELKNCCCIKVVGGLWRRAMPSAVKQAIAHYDFTRQNLQNIMQVADDVYLSTRPSAAVAAISAPTTSKNSDLSTEEVLNQAFNMPHSQEEASAQIIASLAAQVAAISKKFGGGKGQNRGGGKGQGQGGGNGAAARPQYNAANPRWKTPRHADLPPFSSCQRHWKFGKSSFVCLEPTSCPWRKHIQPKTEN